VLDVAGRLYEAVPWPKPARAFDSTGMAPVTRNLSPGRTRVPSHTAKFDADAVASNDAHHDRSDAWASLAIERAAAQEALDRGGMATLVALRDGRLIHADRRAERLLREGDAVRCVDGRVVTPHRTATDRHSELIRGAVDAAAGAAETSGGPMLIPRQDRLPLTILVAPFRLARNSPGAATQAAILFIRDPEASTPSVEAIQALFGATRAEAAVAAALAGGKSIDEFAASQRISLNTARTHLKSIFAKTGTRRQAQLVALLCQMVAMLTM